MEVKKSKLFRKEVTFTFKFKEKPKDFYVYLHRKATDGTVFYVGKGMGDRYRCTSRTNKHWQNIAMKHGVLVEILMDGLQEWYAYELENTIISYYGREDEKKGCLANHDNGGFGGKASELEIYHYKNFKTNEEFSGTKQQFKKKVGFHPYMLIKKHNYTLNGWYTIGNVTEQKLKDLKEDKMRFDKTLYNFVNFRSNEKMTCTQGDFKKITNVNPAQVIARRKNSNHGWTLQEIIDDVGLFKLKNPNTEVNADSTIYELYNLKTNEVYTGTRVNFFKQYNKQIEQLFRKVSSADCVHGWCLLENKERLKDYFVVQQYTFIHKDGEVFTGGRLDFKRAKGIDLESLFYTKPHKTCFGWALMK